MPVHDWTLVEAGIFHDFHTVWIGHIRTALNDGLLPEGYYALTEQHAGRPITDILTLHSTAVTEALPPVTAARRRTVAIRQVSGHRLLGLMGSLYPADHEHARH